MADEYPAWRYHATLEPRRVTSIDEDAALGYGWFDSPKKGLASFAASFEAPAPPIGIVEPARRRRKAGEE